MTATANRGLRRALAAVLILALTLAGAGRVLATVAPAASAVIAGVAAPICHSGADEQPARDASRDCCDDCALLAAVLPAPPLLVRPVPVEHTLAQSPAVLQIPIAARSRDHRLPRGPPAA